MNTSTDQTRYDIFVSYSRRDDAPLNENHPHGWVTAIRDHILADQRRLSTEPLRIFFDTDEIRDMDDWRHRILGALRSSKILLVCLSPNYFASQYCRWEWEEYLKRQVHQLIGSESIAGVYFVEVPGSDEQSNARWLEGIMLGNFTDIRPWFPEGAEALEREEVRVRMAKLGQSLWERLRRVRRAEAAPGNLRRQNVHFVGRREELRKLHGLLGTGTDGMVTAVHGLGGLGKTELVVAYAHAWADCYPVGLWSLKAEGKKELLPLIGELAGDRQLGFTPTEAEKKDAVLLGRGVLAHLERQAALVKDSDPDKGAAALLPLDNVSDPDLLSPAQLATLPCADWLRLVATTRLGPETLRANQQRLALLAVDSLDEDSALALLREHQPPRDARGNIVADLAAGVPGFASPTEDAAAREIVRALGGFTLAIEQVAVFLGLHPETTPSVFLAALRTKGLPVADTLLDRDPDVAGQMLTQTKQLSLILEATLARLDAPARTALEFASLLPPETVPWPWLQTLTVERHPEVGVKDDFGADPWLEVRRRLVGLRLLTSGDHPEVACVHRLVAAHVGKTVDGSMADELDLHLVARARSMAENQAVPDDWELDAMIVSAPHRLAAHPIYELAEASVSLSDLVMTHRSLPAAAAFLASAHGVIERAAASDPANHAMQLGLAVSVSELAELSRKQGDLDGALHRYTCAKEIVEHLAASEPGNIDLQQKLILVLRNLCIVAQGRGDLDGAWRHYTNLTNILVPLAESNPENGELLRDMAHAWDDLGTLSRQSGLRAQSLSNATTSQQILKALVENDPVDTGLQFAQSISLVELADLLMEQGDLAGALRQLTEGRLILERLAASDPANNNWQWGLVQVFKCLGALSMKQGDLTGALCHLTERRAICERLIASDPTNADWQSQYVSLLFTLGDLSQAQSEPAEALRHYTEAKKIVERLAGSDPTNTERQNALCGSLERLGSLAETQGEPAEALRLYTEAANITDRLARADPANAELQDVLCGYSKKLGDLAEAQGNLEEAMRRFTEAWSICEWLAKKDTTDAGRQRDFWEMASKLGDLAQGQGDLAKALRLYSQAKDIAESMAASDPANIERQGALCGSWEALGSLAETQGEPAEALRLYTEAANIAERLVAADPGNAEWQGRLCAFSKKVGDLAEAQGNLEEAMRRFTDAWSICEWLAAKDPTDTGRQRDFWQMALKLGDLAQAQGDHARALRLYTELKNIAERHAANDPANARGQCAVLIVVEKLGALAESQGDLATAMRWFTECHTILKRMAAGDPANAPWQRELAVSYWKLGELCQKRGNASETNDYWRNAHDILVEIKQHGMQISPVDEERWATIRTKLGI